ncbi:MAG: spondin domain-containing protein [Actinomycetota bacterium]|nr:spondin domain-containing protein [Actinomycetota bacterium]
MRRLPFLAIAVLAVALLAVSPASASGVKQWRVTVENLTAAGSQPLSPPLLVVHSRRADVWSVGEIASHGVAAIAEDADNRILESALARVRGIRSVATGAGGPVMPGTAATYTVSARGPYARLSLLTMLVNTNDAFTGLDSVRLRGRERVVYTRAYDAGSERNNELAAFIPGPCCGNPFVRDPEGALVRKHPGIQGGVDLDPAVYGWSGPVARITIERV